MKSEEGKVKNDESMMKGFWHKAFHLYYDGFLSMTLGRTLWIIIGVKLFVIFIIVKVFFFPDFLKQHAGKGHEAEFVAEKLLTSP